MTQGIAVFDIVGTLFSLGEPRARLRDAGAPNVTFDIWFGQALRDYFSRSLAGNYVPMKDVLEATLPRALAVTGTEVEEQDQLEVMETLQNLTPAGGAERACDDLASAGWTLVALTNGSRDMVERLLERSQLNRHFSGVFSCDDIGVSKPHPRVYDEVARQHRGETWLISAHAWDVGGAKDAGWRATWIAAVENLYPPGFPEPDIMADDLAQASRRMVEHMEQLRSSGT